MSPEQILTLLTILEQSVQTAKRIADLLESEELTDAQRAAVRARVEQANTRWEEAGRAVHDQS